LADSRSDCRFWNEHGLRPGFGADGIDSLRIAGRGSDFLFGQAYDGDLPWPRFNLTRYLLVIDYKTPSLQDERTRTQAQNPPLGRGNKPIEEQRQTSLLSGGYTWNANPEGGAGVLNQTESTKGEFSEK